MSMRPFLDHLDDCRVCSANPRNPCSRGAALLKDGADRLTRRLIGDPDRAKA